MKGPAEPVTPMMRRVVTAGVAVVAVVAAIISYSHMRELALMVGEGEWQANLLPLSVDGLMAVASVTALARRRAGMGVGVLAWAGLIGGGIASVTANVAAGHPELADNPVIGDLVSAWPPVALVIAAEILAHGLPRGTTPTGTVTDPAPAEPAPPQAARPQTARPPAAPAPALPAGTRAGTPGPVDAGSPARPTGTPRPAIPALGNGTDAGTRQLAAHRAPETVGTRAGTTRAAQTGPSTEPAAGTARPAGKPEAAPSDGKRQATIEDARAVGAELAAEGAALSARKLAEGLRARGLTCGQKLRDELLAQLRSDEPATSDSNGSEGAVKASEAPAAGREASAVSGIGREENPGSGADVAGDTGDTTRAAARDLSGVGQ